jgi:hypothetical protein
MVSMLTEDRLGPHKIRGLDPNLGRETWNVAETSVQVVAENLTPNARLFEPLLPDVA